MYRFKLSFLIFILLPLSLSAQTDHFHGRVYGWNKVNDSLQAEALFAANVYWLGTTKGTITENDGSFHLSKPGQGSYFLVASFTGYKSDTVEIQAGQEDIVIGLYQDNLLDEVVFTHRQSGSFISRLQPIKTEVITTAGLRKLACCNLAESFENSATVDVNYTDAVSGARMIQLLGLSGIYSQLMTENIPSVRGLGLLYGLNQVPGPWMESIQISKGTSSVINGYEAITGQINIELQKPEEAPPFFLNLYGSSEGRTEINLNLAKKLSDKWSTALLSHGSMLNIPADHNHDGFIDMPLSDQINLLNRWSYKTEHLHAQLGVGFMNESLQGGQKAFYTEDDPSGYYSTGIHSRKYQVFSKIGRMLERPATSIGMVSYFSRYEQSARFDTFRYTGSQNSFYNNLIFQSYVGNTRHTYSTGMSFMADITDEHPETENISRKEIVPGAFFQYNYSNTNSINLIAGIRADYNSAYGWFVSPRLHLKYSPDSLTSIRLSGGKGYRTVNIYSDNLSYLASSRRWIIHGSPDAEEAWNYGIDITRSFRLPGNRNASLSIDYLRTDFIHQWIVDMDHSARELNMYNLEGRSFSNSVQAELRGEIVKGLEFTAAWRMNDVHVTYGDVLMEKPLISKHKGIISLSYALPHNKWQFDLTGQYNGAARIPDLSENPVEYRREEASPGYYILHGQVTRRFRKVEFYAGGENLLNFKQENPIIAAGDPSGEFFDATMIWGPVNGAMVYAGLRLTIK